MLDNNTNKVVWVGVAIGVVVLVGTAAIALFPSVTDSFKPMIRDSMLTSQAIPESLRYGEDKTLTYKDNYISNWNAYYFFLLNKRVDIAPNSYAYYTLDIKVDEPTAFAVDVSNYKDGGIGNDNDDLGYRSLKVYDSQGNFVSDKFGTTAHTDLKANEWYTVQIKYRNNSDTVIFDGTGSWSTSLVFKSNRGVGNDIDVHVQARNFKMNLVHF